MEKNYLLGIDIGTSGTRCIVIDEHGSIIGSAIKEYPLYTPKPGWAEQNPMDWYDATISTIRQVIEKNKINGADIKAIGLSGQMHGSVFLDKNDDIIRPAILWCDQRTEPQCRKIYDIFGYKNFIKIAYNKALPGFTSPKIMWLSENEPGNYGKVNKILLPKDYVRFMISGSYATEVSDASGMLLMDIKKRIWSDDILEGLKINRSFLPDLYESHEISSCLDEKTARLTGLLSGTPIAGGGGDNAAGNVGSGVIRQGLISDSIGTSGVVFAHSDNPVYDHQGRLHSFCHAVPGKWHLMGVTLAAAGSQKWYYGTFGPSIDIEKERPDLKKYKLLDAQAQKIKPGSDGLIFLPYLTGERTPYADAYARGVFFGMSYMHNRDNFVRSIMEGVAFSQLDCLNLMRELGISSEKIILIGGGSRSKIWRKIICDVFESPLITCINEEGPAFGAALISGVGCGIYESVEDAVKKAVRQSSESRPDPENFEIYRKTYNIYRSLYKSLKENFKKLYDIQFD
ncbi:MAG: xylulokinase [Actinomycetota bacterium]|nr:xylulokinase [Actinomycetota bacterium]